MRYVTRTLLVSCLIGWIRHYDLAYFRLSHILGATSVSMTTFSLMTLSIKCLYLTLITSDTKHKQRCANMLYVVFYLLLCWMSLCSVSLCWMSLWWLSWCSYLKLSAERQLISTLGCLKTPGKKYFQRLSQKTKNKIL